MRKRGEAFLHTPLFRSMDALDYCLLYMVFLRNFIPYTINVRCM